MIIRIAFVVLAVAACSSGVQSTATSGAASPSTAAGPTGTVIVANMGRGTDFSLFDKSPTRALAEELGAAFMDLPELHPPAMRKIDRSDASFWAAVHNPDVAPELFTRMDRQRIKVWMQAAYDRLARLGDAI